MDIDEEIDNPNYDKCKRGLFYGMSTCHTITIIDKVVLGDTMELEIFKLSKGFFENHDDSKIFNRFLQDGHYYTKLKIFEFNSIDQRMSTIVQK